MRLIVLFTIGLLLIMIAIRSDANGNGILGSMIGAIVAPEYMKEQ